jgi:uncharacterized surface protein with fasciclin (FAS1) repeats
MKIVSLVLFFFSMVFMGCMDNSGTNPISNETDIPEKRPTNQTIVEIAASNPNFSYLVAAVQFAGLDGTLSGNRQLTVFAPVNSAFEDLAAQLNLQNVGDLLTDQYKDLVTSVLLYHVSPGLKFSTNVVNSGRVNTLLKQFANTKVVNGSPQIGNNTTGFANITAVDIRAKNGVIHVLDKVMIPVLN